MSILIKGKKETPTGSAKHLETNDTFILTTVRKYMTPSVIALIGTTLTIAANSMIVGNYIGTDGLAALNVVNPIYFAFATLGALINVGASTGASVCIGKKDSTRANSFATLALWLTLALSILLSVLGLLFFPRLMKLLGTTVRTESYARGYARILLSGGAAISFMYYPFHFLKTDGRPRQATYMFLLMFVLDLLFNCLFLGKLQMGMEGVALAFVLSTLIGDIFGLCLLYGGLCGFSFGKAENIRDCTASIIRTGSSMALNNLCNIFRTIALNFIILHALSEEGLTAFAIIGTVSNFSNAVISGIGQTISPLIGVFYGEKDNISIRTVIKEAIRMGTKGVLAMTALTAVLSGQIGAVFGVTGLPLLKPAILLFCLSFLPGMLVNIPVFYYFTTDKTGLSNLLTLLRSLILPVSAALLFSCLGLPRLIWLSFAISELITLLCVPAAARLRRISNPHLAGWLLLDSRYEEPGRYLAFSVENTQSAVSDTSARIFDFCREQHMSPKTTMTISLAVEEILLFIFQYCLANMGRQYADIRIMRAEDEIILYFRCAGRLFDPIAYYSDRKSDAASRGELLTDDSLGIAMIVSQAADVAFTRTFGMNNLTIFIQEPAPEGN